MNILMTSTMNLGQLLLGALFFAVLFAVIYRVIEDHSPFSGWPGMVLAICVSLLAVIAIFHTPAPSAAEPARRDLTGFLLLPYAAMGISILFVLLLMMIRKGANLKARWFADRSRPSDSRYTDREIDSVKNRKRRSPEE